MNKRRLGRTNLMVSQVGFGGTWIAELGFDEAVKVLRHAFDLGINYFDTAVTDGDSEEKIGEALKEVRDKCVIATKTGCRTKRESLDDFQNSLKRLKTDCLDIIQLHGIDDEKTLHKAMGLDGSLQTCKAAKKAGLVNFIGITGHKPRVLAKSIETGEFDTVLVPINVITRQALEELLPVAKAHDVGVVAMKPFFVKTSNLITCLYQPALSLLAAGAEAKPLLGETVDEQVTSSLRFALSQDIAAVIPGMRNMHEVEVAAKTGRNWKGLTPREVERFSFDLGNYCRDCAACMPCPENINIPAVLRFQMFSDVYGLEIWAKKLYNGLDVKADKCTGCGECEKRCPYNLPIQEKLKKSQ
jgi:predicted aldo/keto reductase-like oxidoreductase